MSDSTKASSPYLSVGIIGAGFSGLAMAIRLKERFNCENFIIYDRLDGFGGTWLTNKYPGCAVDIPSILYSYSFAPNPCFSRPFPPQSEILQYINTIAERYDVVRHLVGNTEWRAARWQEESSTWMVELEDLSTNQRYYQYFRILISAVGGLVNPNSFNVSGVDDFEGEITHTARWEPTNLEDKHIVVIGNGASATQLIPTIVDQCKTVTQFIRTPQYYVPRLPNYPIPSILKSIFYYLPPVLYLLRILVFLYLEIAITTQRTTRHGRAAEKSRSYIRNAAPEEYWPLLTPSYEFGCKRRVYDDGGYVACLQRHDFHLTDDPLVHVGARSVTTRTKTKYPADIIILANGFSVTHWDVDLHGRRGKSLKEHWGGYGHKEAFKSVAIGDFPNFFYVLGPNSARLNTSAVIGIENFVDLISHVAAPIIENRALYVEVRPECEKAYNQKLHEALEGTVYNDSCASWAVDPKTGRNWAVYPWHSFQMWYETHWDVERDWSYDPTYQRVPIHDWRPGPLAHHIFSTLRVGSGASGQELTEKNE